MRASRPASGLGNAKYYHLNANIQHRYRVSAVQSETCRVDGGGRVGSMVQTRYPEV